MPNKRINGQSTFDCTRCGAALRPWQTRFCSEDCYQAGRWAALVARFYSRIDKNGPTPPHRPELGPCWVWLGKLLPNGYGALGLDRETIYTHRLSYELHIGPIPEGLSVLHECDNRGCPRPEHLVAGTQGQNIRDAVKRGRHRGNGRGTGTPPPIFAPTGDWRRGESNGHARQTEESVREIRRLYATETIGQDVLAERFNTTQTNISLIISRKHWGHVTDA